MTQRSASNAIRRLVADLPDATETDAPLGALTTYRVGGSAAVLVRADSMRHLAAVARCRAYASPGLSVLGLGSNVLVADRGVTCVVVVLANGFSDVRFESGGVMRAGARAQLPVVARASVEEGLAGFEWAVGVPGSVGGAVSMNAGGHGSDIAASATRIRVYDFESGEDKWMDSKALGFGYRHSSLVAHLVVIEAEFQLIPGDPAAGREQLRDIVRWRRDNQPGGHNAGSVFANPPGDSAGRLIDAAGLKGLRIGTAEVSTKHANFIQADPDGRATDVYELIRAVRDRVADAHGVSLGLENRLAGFTAHERMAVGLEALPAGVCIG